MKSGCAGELAELLELSEGQVVDKMLKHALPPLVEAGNKAALQTLAQKAGTDLASLLQDNGATIIAKCLYEGASPLLELPCPVSSLCVRCTLPLSSIEHLAPAAQVIANVGEHMKGYTIFMLPHAEQHHSKFSCRRG